MVLKILEHNYSNMDNKVWLVQWHGDDAPSNTWENHATLKDVEALHQYCATHGLEAFLPKTLIVPVPEKRERGRPAKHHATETGNSDTGQG